MSFDADAIVDRRRLRRKLAFWRFGALAILLVALGTSAALLAGGGALAPHGDFIARIQVQGLIRGSRGRGGALGRLGRPQARAVIGHIDSPGGTCLRASKPLQRLDAVAVV